MKRLTKENRENIRAAVKAAEKKTSGEFVTVITQKSDEYVHIPVLWASILSLIVPPVLIFLMNNNDGVLIFNIQVAAFIVFFLILQVDTIGMFLVPRSMKRLRCRRNAFLQFFQQGVSNTKNRAGILLFVSLAEHHVEIIADSGINQKVPEGTWQSIVDEFIGKVREGKIEEGFTQAVDKCTTILSRHFPYKEGDVNELSDRLIEIQD